MSRITLALGSFALGLCVMYLLASHTSTIVQRGFAQEPAKPERAIGTAVEMGGFEPMVPGLGPRLNVHIEQPVQRQALDGLNCEGCDIDAGVLTYAGGAYNCNPCKIKHERVELRGAAANTLRFLMQTGMLGVPMPKAPPSSPGNPNIKIAADKLGVPLVLVSEGQ